MSRHNPPAGHVPGAGNGLAQPSRRRWRGGTRKQRHGSKGEVEEEEEEEARKIPWAISG